MPRLLDGEQMPTVLRIGPYRISFFSKENAEPPHVHVSREKKRAKFWLEPLVELSNSRGFNGHELSLLRAIVEAKRVELLKAWHEHFAKK